MAANEKILISFLCLILSHALAQESPAWRDVAIDPLWRSVLIREPMLVAGGGAKLIERDGNRFFVAVGVTSIGPESSEERLRQIRVGRIQALKVAAEFIAPSDVSTETILRETTTVKSVGGAKTGMTTKTLDETTRVSVQAMLKSPPLVGTWKSPDGKLSFYAIGTKLN